MAAGQEGFQTCGTSESGVCVCAASCRRSCLPPPPPPLPPATTPLTDRLERALKVGAVAKGQQHAWVRGRGEHWTGVGTRALPAAVGDPLQPDPHSHVTTLDSLRGRVLVSAAAALELRCRSTALWGACLRIISTGTLGEGWTAGRCVAGRCVAAAKNECAH